MTLAWRVLDVLLAVPVGGVLASAALFVGVIGLACWAGWSRDRDLARAGWRDAGYGRWGWLVYWLMNGRPRRRHEP